MAARALRRTLKPKWYGARASALRVAARTLMSFRSPDRLALVHGVPDHEENSLVTALLVRKRYDGRVIVLCSNPAKTREYLQKLAGTLSLSSAGIDIIHHGGGSSLLPFAAAELVFYTHGLLGSPRPVGKRLHVNVWHGNGPKAVTNSVFRQIVGADTICSVAPPWAMATAAALAMPQDTQLVTGNPRQDMLHHTDGASVALEELGLNPARPFVLWMPTYRTWQSGEVGDIVDGPRLSASGDGGLIQDMVRAAKSAQVQLVVKPHPLDADTLSTFDIKLLTSEEIWASGLSLYQFLGASSGLISDYSSVWVDYLETGKPIALLCPDLDIYSRQRGLAHPPMANVAQGLFVTARYEFDEFFGQVASGSPFREEELGRCRSALEFRFQPSRAERMLDEVDQRFAERFGRHPLPRNSC